MDNKGFFGIGIGAAIGALLGSLFGPTGIIMGVLLGSIGGGFAANKISWGTQTGDLIGDGSKSPIMTTSQASTVAKQLDKAEEKATAGVSENSTALASSQKDIYSVIRTAAENSKPGSGSPIDQERAKFNKKHNDEIISALSSSSRPASDIERINLADSIIIINEQLDTKLKAKRKELEAYKDSSTFDIPRGLAIIPTMGSAAIAPYVLRGRVDKAIAAYDKGDIDTFNEYADALGGGKGGVIRRIIVPEATRNASDIITDMGDLIKKRREIFNDREQIAKVATAEIRSNQQEKQRLAEIAKALENTKEAENSSKNNNAVTRGENLASPVTPARQTVQPNKGSGGPAIGGTTTKTGTLGAHQPSAPTQ